MANITISYEDQTIIVVLYFHIEVTNFNTFDLNIIGNCKVELYRIV